MTSNYSYNVGSSVTGQINNRKLINLAINTASIGLMTKTDRNWFYHMIVAVFGNFILIVVTMACRMIDEWHC